MSKTSHVDNMRRIVEFAEAQPGDVLDVKKAEYLFRRFESSGAEACEDSRELASLTERLFEIAEGSSFGFKLFYLSFLVKVTANPVCVEKMLEICLNEINNPVYINFIRWRCINLVFNNISLGSKRFGEMLWLVYNKCYTGFYDSFRGKTRFIPKKLRNKKHIIFFTSQYLEVGHAPTRTLLSRCLALKNAGYAVSIINTREHLSVVGDLPYYKLTAGRFYEKINNSSTVEFEGAQFSLYQCPVPMPEFNEIQKILKTVTAKKPYFIVNIGGNSIVADLCSKIVPVLTVGTVPSSFPTTVSQFRTIGRRLNDQDYTLLDRFGINKESIIECVFTSEFKTQTEKFTRESLNLPEGKTLAMVVGWRLNYEVDLRFLEMISKTLSSGVHYVFIGNTEEIEALVINNPDLSTHASFLGIQADLLAIAEVCDLYVNPKRIGGGTSSAEAMSKGLPVVTLPLGDVWISAGEDFAVSDYNEMYKTINRYASDKQFYNAQSEKARKRAGEVTDTFSEFKAIIEKMQQSELFK